MERPSNVQSEKFAFRMMTGRYEGVLFPLTPHKEIVAGRDPKTVEMTLDDELVSRRHAKFVVTPTGVTVLDLGSTNGTLVNGRKVQQAALEIGDNVLIGTTILRLVGIESRQNEDPVSEAEAREMMDQRATSKAEAPRAMTGRIEEIHIIDLLQLLAAVKKDGTLTIRSRQLAGAVHLRTGKPIKAAILGRKDIGSGKAFTRILGWTNGDFDFLPEIDDTINRELDASTEVLLLEAVRETDELARIKNELPPPESGCTLAHPLPPLRDLSPEELDVLQLAHEARTVGDILDVSRLSDLDTYRALLQLAHKRYLTIALRKSKE